MNKAPKSAQERISGGNEGIPPSWGEIASSGRNGGQNGKIEGRRAMADKDSNVERLAGCTLGCLYAFVIINVVTLLAFVALWLIGAAMGD